jgi:hypothetical protein
MQTVVEETSDRAGVQRPGSDYARLARLIRQEGLLDRRPGYYAFKIIATAMLFAAGWIGFALVGNSWYQLLIAAFMAVLFTHIAFLGHRLQGRLFFLLCAGGRLAPRPRPACSGVRTTTPSALAGSFPTWLGRL